MVFVVIKNWLVGNRRGEKSNLLPFTRDNTRRSSNGSLTNGHGNNDEADENNNTVLRRGSGALDNGDEDDDGASDDYSYASSESTNVFTEGSFVQPRVLTDIVIGLSDGLTVPFALTAGLSGLGNSKLVITGGLAELVSGAISMGLGGYLAAVGESEYYQAQVDKEKELYQNNPAVTMSKLQTSLREYKLTDTTIKSFVSDLEKSQEQLILFIMQVCNGLEEPADSRQLTSALTIGLSYFIGGFIPLIPYFCTHHVHTGLYISVGIMAVTLFLFGSIKTMISLGTKVAGPCKVIGDGFKMMLIGGVAAASAWGLVRAIDHK